MSVNNLKRKRVLLESPNSSPTSISFAGTTTTTALAPALNRAQNQLIPTLKKRSTAPVAPDSFAPGECGRLVTVDRRGRRVLVIQQTNTFSIGRADNCDYSIQKQEVSALHCKVYALTSDRGEIFAALEDVSTNGTMWNERRLQRGVVILSDGDRVEIGGQSFCYHHTAPKVPGDDSEATIAKESIKHYVVLNRALGTGSFGTVYLAFNTRSLKQMACKKILRQRGADGRDRAANIKREVSILKALNHPNITAVEDVFVDPQFVNIFLELSPGGDLFSYLEKRITIQPAEAKFIFFQILKALEYLHIEKNCSHRDLKLENVIVAGAGPFPKVLVADFGAAKFANSNFLSITGTLVYLSPEVILAWTRHEGYDGKRLDMWSSGILLAHLLCGHHPFSYTPDDTSSQLTLTESQCGASFVAALGDYDEEEHIPSRDAQTCSNVVNGYPDLSALDLGGADNGEARSLVSHLLTYDPVQRCTAPQAFRSAWMAKSAIELEGLWRKIVKRG